MSNFINPDQESNRRIFEIFAVDRRWEQEMMEWIVSIIEEQGEWQLNPKNIAGSNLVLTLHEEVEVALVIISRHTPNEIKDIVLTRGIRTIPIFVEDIPNKSTMFGGKTYINIAGMNEEDAKQAILQGISFERKKPTRSPFFPGATEPALPASFPNASVEGSITVESILAANPLHWTMDHLEPKRHEFVRELLTPLPRTVHIFFREISPLIAEGMISGDYSKAVEYALNNHIEVTSLDLRKPVRIKDVSLIVLLFYRAATFQRVFLLGDPDYSGNIVKDVVKKTINGGGYVDMLFEYDSELQTSTTHLFSLFPNLQEPIVKLLERKQEQRRQQPGLWLEQIPENRRKYVNVMLKPLRGTSILQPPAVGGVFNALREQLPLSIWVSDYGKLKEDIRRFESSIPVDFFENKDFVLSALGEITFLELVVLHLVWKDEPFATPKALNTFQVLLNNNYQAQMLTLPGPGLVEVLEKQQIGNDLPDMMEFFNKLLIERSRRV